jgi:hypothetical protein
MSRYPHLVALKLFSTRIGNFGLQTQPNAHGSLVRREWLYETFNGFFASTTWQPWQVI